MNFTDTAKAPIVIFVGEEKLEIPKFTRRDWKAWGAEIDAKRLADATAGMTPDDRFKRVAFFSIPPATAPEVRQLVFTDDGQERVIRTCMSRMGWSEERIVSFLDDNDPEDIQLLAIQLASIRPRMPQPPTVTPAASTPTPEGEQSADPIKMAETDLASD